MLNVTVVVPYDEEWNGKKALENTIKSVKSSGLNYLVISKTRLNGVKHFVFDYKNIWQAFNKSINKVSTKYVTFILPGDFINSKTYDFDSDFDLIQLQHIRTDHNKTWVKYCNRPDTYNLESLIPQHINLICDKAFKTDILKEHNLRFCHNNKFSALIITLEYMSYTKKMNIVSNEIVHTVKNETYSIDEECIMLSELFRKLTAIKTDNWVLKERIEKELKRSRYIDYVFPYVTSDDLQWKKLYKANLKGTESAWAAGIERFRDSGTLKYVLRGIEKHMPWIRKVHIIVMQESQIPSWINKNEVDIITHDEFIPKNLLPTFNSCTIDMFIGSLPRVSNFFIFSNDDLFTFKDLTPEDFFNKNVPIYSVNLRNFIKSAPGDGTRLNVYNLIFNTNQTKRVVTTQHGPIPYRKDWALECYKQYERKLINSCSKFRESKNYNQYVFALYQVFNKVVINTMKNIISYTVKGAQVKRLLNDNFSNYDFICLNDYNDASEETWNAILDKIERLLPEKSKYEV